MSDYVFTKDGIISPKGGKIAFKTKPYEHQLKALREFGDKKFFALLAEMGTGKTWIAINNFAYLYRKKLVHNMLVVAPNGVQWNWVNRELPTHLPLSNDVIYAGYSGGMNKAEKRKFEEVVNPLTPAGGRILCVNWETLSNKKGFEICLKFINLSPDKSMIVLDESDYMKNPNAKCSQNVMNLKAFATYRRIMTGTPITNSPFDAFSQYNFLHTGILGFKSFIAFQHRYGAFLPNDNPIVQSIIQRTKGKRPLIPLKDKDGKKVYKNLDELKAKIMPYSFRVLKRDCLDLPDKVYSVIEVGLTNKQKECYNMIGEEGLAILNNEEISIVNKVAILTKLCQITGNNFITPAGDTIRVDTESNPKLDKLQEIVIKALSNGWQLIVWARYRAEIFDIKERMDQLGISSATYFGDTSKDERENAINGFQAGEISVFISNPQSGGTGLTLTNAAVVVYYSNSFSLHDRLQSEDRAHRIGQQHNKVFYIDLVARNTVDCAIIDNLKNKLSLSENITSFKNYFKV